MSRASLLTCASIFAGLLAGAAGCGGRVVVDHQGSTGAGGVNAGGAGGVGSPTSASVTSSVSGSGGIVTSSTSSNGSAGGSACGPVDDGNVCTIDACQNGVPIHTPAPAGAACSPDGAVCDGAGNCPGCLSASVCAGEDTECSLRTCIAGQCGQAFTAAGTVLLAQSAGDCRQLVCDGIGDVALNGDPTDLPDDSNPCTADLCTGGIPSHLPQPQGTPCGAALFCNVAGMCVGCTKAADCPGVDTECKAKTCIAGGCGVVFTPAGTLVAAQTAGNCEKATCDGSGQIVNLADSADLPPDDGNACTDEACIAGVPGHPAKPNGSLCNDGDACTQTDTCQSGACAGQNPVVCSGTDVCTGGSCVLACTWVPAPALPTAVNPSAVVGADLNGDGKIDLAVADAGGKVSVLLGNGNGTFAAKVDYLTDAGSIALAARDLNGDGKPDLAVANSGAGTMSVLFNKGNGTFAPAAAYPTNAGCNSVAALDLNGDGHPDLVATNFNAGNLSVLINNGNGTFGPASSYATGVGPSGIAALDLNSDGHPDLAVADRGGAGGVRVLLNSGTGFFAPGVDYPAGPGPWAIAALDLNGDGHPDLAAANAGDPNNGTVSVLLGSGTGTFAAPVNYPTGLLPTSVVALDLNGDGQPDLAVAGQSTTNPGTGVVSVLKNKGGGVFAPRIDQPAGGNFISVAALDLNGDGHPDFAVTDFANNKVLVLLAVCSP